jgi:2-oxoglutarate ferredoxin oxidoreductase subunit gamma
MRPAVDSSAAPTPATTPPAAIVFVPYCVAEELGRKVVLNIVMVGFFAAVTNLLDPDAVRKAVEDSVPPAMQKLNAQAFDKGYEYGSQLMLRLAESGETDAVALESV